MGDEKKDVASGGSIGVSVYVLLYGWYRLESEKEPIYTG